MRFDRLWTLGDTLDSDDTETCDRWYEKLQTLFYLDQGEDDATAKTLAACDLRRWQGKTEA